jgi:uncharacterized protein YeaO (DUF488 family)
VIRLYRLGTPRAIGEGVRIGTVRRPPRGVRKEDLARGDYYDAWFPELAPSVKLLTWIKAAPMTDARWERFQRLYSSEMKQPDKQRIIDVLAHLSHQAHFSIGCHCEDESRCHRSILRELLRDRGALLEGSGPRKAS